MAAPQGATVAVPVGTIASVVLGTFTAPYRLAVTPAWATDRFVIPANKLATQFEVDFTIPAPAGGSSYDWAEVE